MRTIRHCFNKCGHIASEAIAGMSVQPQRVIRNTLCNFCVFGLQKPLPTDEIIRLRGDFMAQRSLALLESTKEEERVLCDIPTNDFTLIQTRRMFELLSALEKVDKSPSQPYEELHIRSNDLKKALARSALTIFYELDLASLIHRAELSLHMVIGKTHLFRLQGGTDIERPFVETEFSLKRQAQSLVGIYEERREDLNLHECLAILRLETHDREWGKEMRDACEWIGHDNKQSRLDGIAALVTSVPLESLAIQDRECSICRELLGSTLEDREAELPVKLPCGHQYGSACLTQWLLENTTCGFCRCDYSEMLPDDFQDIDESEDEDSDDVMSDVEALL